jgi:hypothetical protein
MMLCAAAVGTDFTSSKCASPKSLPNSLRDDMGQIEQDAAQRGMGCKDCSQQLSRTAADIGHNACIEKSLAASTAEICAAEIPRIAWS